MQETYDGGWDTSVMLLSITIGDTVIEKLQKDQTAEGPVNKAFNPKVTITRR